MSMIPPARLSPNSIAGTRGRRGIFGFCARARGRFHEQGKKPDFVILEVNLNFRSTKSGFAFKFRRQGTKLVLCRPISGARDKKTRGLRANFGGKGQTKCGSCFPLENDSRIRHGWSKLGQRFYGYRYNGNALHKGVDVPWRSYSLRRWPRIIGMLTPLHIRFCHAKLLYKCMF